ncbi:MAG: sensor domain-containing diguanylate cyclase [Chloroflexi bacterium]|nr:sensor domain-containing diguanylate cyclase [Chloroflexota bacterium]
MSSDDPSRDPRSSLSSAIAAVLSGAELDPILGSILDAAVAGLGAMAGAIFLQDPDRPSLTLAASAGLDAAAVSALSRDAQQPEHPFPLTARDRLATFDRAAASPLGGDVLGAYLPLIVSTGGVEVVLGSMGLTWPGPRVLDATERETLINLAGVAALAVDRARLSSSAAERSDWFERMAHTDPLTGLANDRTVARVLEHEIARASRQGSEMSLTIFDVDDFQATNADDGHGVGDDVLRHVAAVLSGAVRQVDTVGRIGGDEFVLVAPGPAGLMVSRRILDGIAALPAVAGRAVSVSAGVATYPADGSDSEALVQAAKEALARAQVEGRGSAAAGTPG